MLLVEAGGPQVSHWQVGFLLGFHLFGLLIQCFVSSVGQNHIGLNTFWVWSHAFFLGRVTLTKRWRMGASARRFCLSCGSAVIFLNFDSSKPNFLEFLIRANTCGVTGSSPHTWRLQSFCKSFNCLGVAFSKSSLLLWTFGQSRDRRKSFESLNFFWNPRICKGCGISQHTRSLYPGLV